MIERMEFGTEPDIAAIAGRATLLGGAAFGLQQTGKMDFASGYFRRGMSKMAGSGFKLNEAVNPVESQFGFGSFMKSPSLDIRSRDPIGRTEINTEELAKYMSGGYKGRSKGLQKEVLSLHGELLKKYDPFDIKMEVLGQGTRSDLLRVGVKGGPRFDIPLVSAAGEISLGQRFQNRYVARSVMKSRTETSLAAEGMDVALTRKYKELLGDITQGKVSPRDLQRTLSDRAVWEEMSFGVKADTKAGAGLLSQLRREDVIVDPFKELTREGLASEMRDITLMKGYGAGNAGRFAAGIVPTPESLLAKGLPGAESSISSYQLFRQSAFTGTGTSIDWLPGLDAGLGEFQTGVITDKKAYEFAMGKMGMKIGELAEEEAILNTGNKVGIKNEIYSFKIDANREQTKLMKRIMGNLYASGEATGLDPKMITKAMTSPGMNLSIDEKVQQLLATELQDINKGMGRLRSREDELIGDIRGLREKRGKYFNVESRNVVGEQIKRKISSLRKVRGAMSEWGHLGFDPTTGEKVMVPGGDMRNYIKNITMEGGVLRMTTRSQSKLGIGSKFFTGGGGGKVTVKAQTDLPMVMGWMEAYGRYGKEATAKQAEDFRGAFKDVSLLMPEAPVRLKKGTLAPREAMSATIAYASNIMKTGSEAEIERLGELGIKEGKFVGTPLSGKELISKIKGWHPGQDMKDIFLGEEFVASRLTQMVAAPDISSVQSGIGQRGSLSERGAYNLQAMGMGDFLEDILSNRAGKYNPMSQMKELEAARSIAADFAAQGTEVSQFEGKMGHLFEPNLEARRKFLGDKGRQTISLGKNIGGTDKVTVFASDIMGPFIGEKPGGGMSDLDRATRSLLESTMGQDEAFQEAKAKKYRIELAKVEQAVSKNMFKGKKIRGSMYGQAVSALEGMDQAARELKNATAITGDVAVPLIAMTKVDIRRQFGKEAAKQAAEGQLWGLMTREPIEGVHSTLPVNIRMAEEFGDVDQREMAGRVFVSGKDKAQDLVRKSLFLDFDKDTVNVIAATSAKSKAAIEGFYGYGGKKQTMMGSEYFESLKRMASFELKGREPLDILQLANQELLAVNAAQKGLEKGAIGSFSNEFKNIHIGLREQMQPKMGRAAAEAYYLGEDFSHLFIENILKAKHQRKESLIANSVSDVSSLFTQEVGTKYAAMGAGERAQELQRVFDELSFGSKEMADSVRAANAGAVSEKMAEQMGFAGDLAKARSGRGGQEAVERVLAKATKQKDAYKKIANIKNLENVMTAHKLGRDVQKQGNYAGKIAQRNISKLHASIGFLSDIGDSTSKYMSRGLKNVAKWGILPTAGIGLMASLTTKPKILEPAAKTGKLHEKGQAIPEGVGEASAGKTLFSIPEPRYESAQVSGVASASTNFEALRAYSQQGGRNMNVRLKDHRSNMDKYTIEEMVEKGY